MFVHEPHDRRSFGDRGGAALDDRRVRPRPRRRRTRCSAVERAVPAPQPGRMNPSASRASTSPSQSVQGSVPRKRNGKQSDNRLPSASAGLLCLLWGSRLTELVWAVDLFLR